MEHTKRDASFVTSPQERLRTACMLIRPPKGVLFIGLALLTVNRATGMILPASTGFLVDEIIGRNRRELVLPLLLVIAAATALQASTSFASAMLLCRAGQRLIAELRCKVQSHVLHLPFRFYDANNVGTLLSRVMNDVEGARHLIGPGLLDLIGGIVTALVSMVVLFRISALMTVLTLLFVLVFIIVLRNSLIRLQPLYQQGYKLTAFLNGRLTEVFSGIRVVKVSRAE